MFNGVVINPEHVLHQFLTEREQTYNLRSIFKYADDTYLVVPAANSSTRCQEIEQIGVGQLRII